MSFAHHNSESLLPFVGGRADASTKAAEAAPSAALAGFLVAAVVFVNEASFRNASQETFSVDWQVLLRLAVCGACGLYALRYLSTAWAALESFPAALVSIFGLWCAVTVPFAVNVPYAAASCTALWCIILFAPVALLHLGPKRLFLSVFASLAAFAIISCLVYFVAAPLGRTEFVSPDGDIQYRLGGLTHANGLGRQMALMVMAGLFLGSRKLISWRKLAPGLALALVTLYFTDSRTSMLAIAAATTCLYVESSGRGTLGKLASIAGLLIVIAAIAVIARGSIRDDALLSSISRSGTAEEMYTFTGRTNIWQYAISRIADSPIVGYGCGCSRFPMCHYDEFPITHAHNLLLNVMIDTGVFGAVIVALALMTQVRDMFRRPSLFPDMMIVMVLVFGVADIPLFSVVPDAPTLLWIMALLWRPLVDAPSVQAVEAPT